MAAIHTYRVGPDLILLEVTGRTPTGEVCRATVPLTDAQVDRLVSGLVAALETPDPLDELSRLLTP